MRLLLILATCAGILAGPVSAQVLNESQKIVFDEGVQEYFALQVGLTDTRAAIGVEVDGAPRAVNVYDTLTGELLQSLAPSDLAPEQFFGLSLAITGETAIGGATGDDVNGVKSGSAYIFSTTTGEQLFKLLPSDGAAFDLFGGSVAINADVSLVGGIGNDLNGSSSGAAYLFDNTTGQQILRLEPAGVGAFDYFGCAAALSDTNAVVGAYGDDDRGSSAGAAYIFDAATGEQRFKLVAADGDSDDQFGRSVAIGGNVVIVGAVGDDDGGDSSGAAYVFDATTGAQLFKLLPEDGGAQKEFGISVAISGTTAIIGVKVDSETAPAAGAAYLFDITTGQQIAKLLASDGEGFDYFGSFVAISGDSALVLSRFDHDNGLNAGSAYLFDSATGVQLLKVLPSNGAPGDSFGASVAIEGDTIAAGGRFNIENNYYTGAAHFFSADSGYQYSVERESAVSGESFGDAIDISGTTAVIGAGRVRNKVIRPGAAYLYNTTTGEQLFELEASDGGDGDRFGWAVAIDGSAVIVGAQNNSETGAAYLFDANTGEQRFKLIPEDGTPNSRFGSSVDIAGTIAIVGARWNNENGSSSGAAYLFDITTGQQLFKLLPSDGQTNDLFGWSVAISETTAVVGTPYDDDQGPDAGAVYLFDITTGQQLEKIVPSDGSPQSYFGLAVSISEDFVLIGAPADSINGLLAGSAYLFDRATGSQLVKLLPTDSDAENFFGGSLQISGSKALVGASGDDDNGTDSGSAYLFDLSAYNPCPSDLNNSGATDLPDLNLILANFGQFTSTGDTNNDGVVDLADLNAVLAAFGTTCP